MSSMFHYTDASGLIGIVSSESLYATDYRYLNDAAEAGMIRNYIMPIFEMETATVAQKLVSAGFLKEDYQKELGTAFSKLEAESLYRAFVKGVDNVSPFFVLSFCRHEASSYEYKHGLLSQWRAYADGGGFAIEFDENELDNQAKLERESFAYAGFKSDDVLYSDHGEQFNSADYQGLAGEMIRSVFESVGLNVVEITGQKNLDEAVIKFAETAPFFKHQAFHEEAEYRMVFVCIRANMIPEEIDLAPKKVKVRQKNGFLIPYIELFDTKDVFAAVKAIIIGPHPFQDKQEEAVKMLLESEGLKIPLRKSEIPYRR